MLQALEACLAVDVPQRLKLRPLAADRGKVLPVFTITRWSLRELWGWGLHSSSRNRRALPALQIVAPYIRQRGAEAEVPAEDGQRRNDRRHRDDRAGRRLRPAGRQAPPPSSDGDHYVLNGSKTFITNGYLCDLVIVVAKTDPAKGAKGTSLLVVDADGRVHQGQAAEEGRA
jgi:hypothetical protein